MGQLGGPQPGAPRPPGDNLGAAAPLEAFSPTRPPDGSHTSGRLGAWFPDEAELRTWGGAELMTLAPTIQKIEHPALRLVQARFPLPLPTIVSVGATDPRLEGGTPWLNCPIFFRAQIGVAAGVHTFPLATSNVPISGVFTFSTNLAVRSIVIDAFFFDSTPVAISARVWAGVAPFG